MRNVRPFEPSILGNIIRTEQRNCGENMPPRMHRPAHHILQKVCIYNSFDKVNIYLMLLTHKYISNNNAWYCCHSNIVNESEEQSLKTC